MTGEYNKLFKTGDPLILELTSGELFNGIYADGGKDRVSLCDVVQHNNGNKLGGMYDFYRSEIKMIHRLKPPPSKEVCQQNKSSKESQSPCNLIKISEEEYVRLKEMSKDYLYIDNPDKRYHDAIKVLSEMETLGVVCLGIDKGRTSLIHLLVMCTWKQVYIFDLINVTKRELYAGLKEIFESEYICKVIHKSAGLVDILYRQYNVYMQNCFDPHIVDLIMQKNENNKENNISNSISERDISECLTFYLNLPKSLLDHALAVPCKSWNDRPLSEKNKLYASQIATYLIVLKDCLQKRLLKHVYDTVTKVQDCVYDMDDFQFMNYNMKKEIPREVQKLIPDLDKLNFNGS